MVASVGPMLRAQSSSMEVVTRLEHELLDAALHKDAAALDRLLAEDLVATGPSGKVLDKSHLVARWATVDSSITDESSWIDEVSVRDFGSVVIVHGRITDAAREAGVMKRSVTRVTDVWAKRCAGWQLVAMHESLIPDAPRR